MELLELVIIFTMLYLYRFHDKGECELFKSNFHIKNTCVDKTEVEHNFLCSYGGEPITAI